MADSQRARITAAFIQIASERGYSGASVSRVVSQAGVSREVFYSLFENKEGCWEESIDAALRARTDAVHAALDGEGPALKRVQAAIGAYLAAVAADPAASRCIALQRPPQVLGVPAQVLAVRRQLTALLVEQLQPADPFAVQAYVTMVDGLVDERITAGAPEDVTELAPSLSRLLEPMLRAAAA